MFEVNGRLFDWDIRKNLINIEKHGVSFKMAASAFFDTQSIILYDEKHSQDEERFILIGIDKLSDLLIVCHCYRNSGEVVRIISARKADEKEEDYYLRRNSNGY